MTLRQVLGCVGAAVFAIGTAAFAVHPVTVAEGIGCGTGWRADLDAALETDRENGTLRAMECIDARQTRQAWSAPLAAGGALSLAGAVMLDPNRTRREVAPPPRDY